MLIVVGPMACRGSWMPGANPILEKKFTYPAKISDDIF